MENRDNKKTSIDEAHLMSIMAGEVKPAAAPEPKEPEVATPPPVPVTKAGEKPRGRKLLDGSYGDRFLREHTMTRRGEKSIYIRQEYHERLSRIVQVIGDDRIPLYAYLDNILQHHFDLFEKHILEDFENKYKPLF